jgi:glycosyltransferase involved in cell wall biosynthesis
LRHGRGNRFVIHRFGFDVNRVSIIIPCCNAGSHLAEAVQSALAQTSPDVEIVIIDDGSTDPATLRLLKESDWPRTRIFPQNNAGPAAARNRAIREATGEYILPLDADDMFEPTYAAKAAAVLDAQSDVGIVYCQAAKFGAEEGPWSLPVYSPDELALGNVIFVSAMFRKADWKLVGGFDETLRHGMEDYDFWIRLVHAGRKVVRLDETLFHCRVREQSRTALFEEDREEVVATYARIFRKNRDFFAEHAESLFRQHFALLKEASALRARLAEESRSAARERTSLVEAKAEADRYNAALHSELEQVHTRYAALQRRFRWLKPLWPAEKKNSRTQE